jgi:hypothetical protein
MYFSTTSNPLPRMMIVWNNYMAANVRSNILAGLMHPPLSPKLKGRVTAGR